MTGAPELSIVVPAYGCRECLQALHERLTRTLENEVASWELILVDDGSPDASWVVIEGMAERDSRVRGLRLSRNFGQHAAITAGLAEARGERVAVMDCDLQDPPEELPRLLAAAREGRDVVLCRRTTRSQSLGRRLATAAYFRLRRAYVGSDIGPDFTTLSLLSRPVVDAFLRVRDRDRHYLLIVDWLGFERDVLETPHHERVAGRSSYTWRSLIKVGLDGIFFQTTVLLRWIVYLGFLVALLGCGLALFYLYTYATEDPLPGYTSIAVLILVMSGFIIVSGGIAALYVGKIFEQVKDRPLYVVERRAGESRDARTNTAPRLP